MTSFGYRSNPRYAIKECSSCETLYTRDCVCSTGTVEDKILVPKPPKNCARCTRYGYLVDGPHCQGCALLRQELEEIMVTHFPDFQNTSEPSNASTNVVNAPREPYVVKQDNESFVDEIIFDLNRAPDSPNQFHCFYCKDVLRDGEACKRCTCAKCGSGLGKGLCYICGHNQNSLNDSPSISETSSHSPPNINHCCYECGDPLDGIFCKRCTCKSCGKDAYIGYCSSKVQVISIPEPCNNQTIDELSQALPIFHLTFHSEAESPFTLDSTPTYVDESQPTSITSCCQPINHDYYHGQNSCYDSNSIGFDQCQTPQYTVNHPIFNAHNDLLISQTMLNEQMTQLKSMCEIFYQSVQKKREEKRIEEEQAAKAPCWKLLVCYDDDDDEDGYNPLNDNIISELPSYSAVTPTEPVDSLSMGDEHLDTIPATESDEFIKSCVKNLVPNPSKSEDEFECDVPAGFTTFSIVLFDADYDSDSSDDQSLLVEDVREKIYSNPLFDEEIILMKIDPHSFNAESDIIESLPNHDSSIDSLVDEFDGELTLLKSFPSGIDKTDCHPEKEIRFAKRLLYDNSYPRPPEEIVSDNSNTDIESFSPSPIPNKDRYNSLNDSIIPKLPPYSAVTPTETIDSLSMVDEHLDTIPEMKSDEFIKSCVKNLVPNPRSMPNRDSLIIISSKIDSLFDEFAGELTLLKSISPRIDKTDCHPEKEIRLTKRLLYDNSSPRPPKEIVSDNSNADIESFSPSPILNEDSDPLMEEIDLYFNPDDPLPSGIEDDDYDSERDIPILEELLDNYSLSLSAPESYHFDIPSPYRPPAKPPDGMTGTLNIKMMGDVFDQKVPITNLTITLILNQEKSPDLLSHLGFEAFQPSAECPMIINGKNIPLLEVPLFYFYPLDQSSMGGIRSSLAT
nr:hypothetical protein [Tanacetum cinerariifolium]